MPCFAGTDVFPELDPSLIPVIRLNHIFQQALADGYLVSDFVSGWQEVHI